MRSSLSRAAFLISRQSMTARFQFRAGAKPRLLANGRPGVRVYGAEGVSLISRPLVHPAEIRKTRPEQSIRDFDAKFHKGAQIMWCEIIRQERTTLLHHHQWLKRLTAIPRFQYKPADRCEQLQQACTRRVSGLTRRLGFLPQRRNQRMVGVRLADNCRFPPAIAELLDRYRGLFLHTGLPSTSRPVLSCLFGLCRRGNVGGRLGVGERSGDVVRILGNEFAAEGFGEDGGVEARAPGIGDSIDAE